MTARRSVAVLAIALLAGSCAGPPAPPAPARAVIFIPGFGGSELIAAAAGTAAVTLGDGTTRSITVAQGEQVWPHFHTSWPFDAGRIFDDDYYRILRIDASTDNLAIHASGNLYTELGGYGEVEPFFTGSGYQTGRTLFLFGWDFRRSAFEAARKLDDLISTVLAQQPLPTAERKVDIVAHSAGTLVARAFFTDTDPIHTYVNRPNVARAILLGGPGLGVPDADDTLLVGHCLQDTPFHCIIPPSTQKYAFATSEGAAQNATSQSYYANFHEQDAAHPVPYTTASITDAVPPEQGGPPPAYGGSGQPAQLGYQFLQSTLAQAMPLLPMGRAEAFHQSDLSWIVAVLGQNTTLLMALGGGSGQCAVGQVRNSTSVDRIQIDGDSVVPRQAAIFGEDLSAGYLTNVPAGRLFVFVRPLQHGALSGDPGLPTVLAWLRGDPTVSQGTILQHTCPATAP